MKTAEWVVRVRLADHGLWAFLRTQDHEMALVNAKAVAKKWHRRTHVSRIGSDENVGIIDAQIERFADWASD